MTMPSGAASMTPESNSSWASESGVAIVRDWYWCYADEVAFEIPGPAGSLTPLSAHPRGAVPAAPGLRTGTAAGRWVVAAAVLGSGVSVPRRLGGQRRAPRHLG